VIGLAIGLRAAIYRWIDAIVMRIMDGLMAIPSILLAIALITLTRPGLGIVIVAIVIPEIPRVVRLVRAWCCRCASSPMSRRDRGRHAARRKHHDRHILPNTLAPLIVQATYVCASAILIEAILSSSAPACRRDPELGQHHRRGPRFLADRALDDPSSPAPSSR
jgi:peptide/nickel transport system permease protein